MHTQIDLEKKYSKQYLAKEMKLHMLEYHTELFNLTAETLLTFMDKDHDYEPIAESNREVLTHWNQKDISPYDVLASILTTVAVAGRTTLQDIVSQLVYLTGTEDFKSACRTVGQLISIVAASGLIKVEKSTLRMVSLNFEIDKYFQGRLATCMYMPPALIPLKPRSNSDAGWFITKKSIFLNKNHHEGNAPLHWLDTLNSIPFSIDLNMLKYDEEVDITEADKLKNFMGKRMTTIRTIKEMLAHGNEFYFIHRFCARYRAYAAGYALSPQGNDYRKALLNLHKKELLTDNYNF